jgi:hypothetical protein
VLNGVVDFGNTALAWGGDWPVGFMPEAVRDPPFDYYGKPLASGSSLNSDTLTSTALPLYAEFLSKTAVVYDAELEGSAILEEPREGDEVYVIPLRVYHRTLGNCGYNPNAVVLSDSEQLFCSPRFRFAFRYERGSLVPVGRQVVKYRMAREEFAPVTLADGSMTTPTRRTEVVESVSAASYAEEVTVLELPYTSQNVVVVDRPVKRMADVRTEASEQAKYLRKVGAEMVDLEGQIFWVLSRLQWEDEPG